MFSKEKRYMTKGINKRVDIRLQMFMWKLIEELKEEEEELDYLQVFDIKKIDSEIVIEHRQEIPKYKKKYVLRLDNIDVMRNVKVFAIDDGRYLTMLLSEEY